LNSQHSDKINPKPEKNNQNNSSPPTIPTKHTPTLLIHKNLHINCSKRGNKTEKKHHDFPFSNTPSAQEGTADSWSQNTDGKRSSHSLTHTK
jgi:hypothetical protein